MARNAKTIRIRKKLVANATELKAPPTLQHVTMNIGGAKTRYDTYLGKQYLVVPMVMLTEGVHHGSQGPILYENADMRKAPFSWNKKPIVVYHPEINGVGVSACDPDILNNREIGLIFNARVEASKLHAEAWLDEERVKKVDNRILEALEAEEMIELSTGLFMDLEEKAGTWNEDEAYIGVARNYQPDHLAVLPDKTGACSIADGAGLLRNARHGLSHENLRGLLHTTLHDKFPNVDFAFIVAVFDEFFIYELDDPKLFRQFYTIQNDVAVTLDGDPDQVVRVTEFRTLAGDFVGNDDQGESDMNKEVFVLALIANALTAFTADDKPYLMGLNEERLRKFGPTLNDDGTEKPKEEDVIAPAAPTTPPPAAVLPPVAPTGNAVPAPQTVAQFIADAPVGMRGALNAAVRTHEGRKAQVIAVIAANANNRFTPEQLQGMDLVTLEAMCALAGQPAQVAAQHQSDYSGLGDLFTTPTVNAGEPEEAMGLPVMNFTSEA